MALLTDPARELVDVCERLSTSSGERGDVFIAKTFGVEVWSHDYHQITFCIMDRVELVRRIISDFDIDEDAKNDALSHLSAIRKAFSTDYLMNAWHTHGVKLVSRENIQPIKMLASQVRKVVSYPKFTEQEHDEILILTQELESWLVEHQSKEFDFIRQALLDGVRQFKFRFEKIGWFGYGYTVSSLKDVIAAYMALERAIPDQNEHPDSAAILLKTGAFIKSFYEKANLSRNVFLTGDFILKAYGAAHLAYDSGSLSGVIASIGAK